MQSRLAHTQATHANREYGAGRRASNAPRFEFPSQAQTLHRAQCACGGGCPRCRSAPPMQTRLAVSRPGDAYEREADRVAEQVMRAPAPAEGAEENLLLRKAAPSAAGSDAARTGNVLSGVGPGPPLDSVARNFFEPRFGRDFGDVRLHTDAEAAASARSVHAEAYTVGSDIVLGQNAAGADNKLLAHELAHVVQQNSAAAPVRLVQRQPQRGTGAATQQGTAATQPAAAAGWQGCAADRIDGLNSDLADAVAWVDEAIADLQRAPLSEHTRGALGRYLSTEPADVSGAILPALQHILTELRGGAVNFQCKTQEECDAIHEPGHPAWSSYPITLCDSYFTWMAILIGGSSVRSGLLIHECAHHAGLGGDTYEFTWPFPGLSVADRLQNADSLVAFVLTNHYASLPPVTGPVGFEPNVGAGALFQQGVAEPSFVVTVDVEAPLARRVFHFFDLTAGIRVDVDSRGSVILSESLGARVFTPPDVSRIPWYLDLSAGGATSLTGPARIGGPSAEARAGVQLGHFGAGIDYRHIWNLLRANSDIDELTISGEIRF